MLYSVDLPPLYCTNNFDTITYMYIYIMYFVHEIETVSYYG
jgi:hypothetical protein